MRKLVMTILWILATIYIIIPLIVVLLETLIQAYTIIQQTIQ